MDKPPSVIISAGLVLLVFNIKPNCNKILVCLLKEILTNSELVANLNNFQLSFNGRLRVAQSSLKSVCFHFTVTH